jgi:hypothetical protein
VKERCESNNFIANDDKLEKVARVFYIKQDRWGIEQDSGETERERVCERWRIA